MARQQSLRLTGNVLDLTEAGNGDPLLISVDGVHESGSSRTWRDEVAQPQVFVQAFTIKIQGENIVYEPANAPIIDNINHQGTEDILKSTDEVSRAKEQKVLSESLYNVGNLRKKGRADDA